MATKRKRRATAYHEAGHVVVAIALDISIKSVSINQGEEYDGLTVATGVGGYHHKSKRGKRTTARDIIISTYAGMHAQKLIDPSPKYYHGQQDQVDAIDVSWEWNVLPRRRCDKGDDCHMTFLRTLDKKAGRLVKRHEKAIKALAEALIEKEVLDGPEAEEIVQPFL
jgi:ATP-dependent Zn protease